MARPPQWVRVEHYSEGLSITENKFDYYGTALTVGFGFELLLSDNFGLVFDSQISAAEFRKENDSMNIEGTNLWENSLLLFGQMSTGVGLQCAF